MALLRHDGDTFKRRRESEHSILERSCEQALKLIDNPHGSDGKQAKHSPR